MRVGFEIKQIIADNAQPAAKPKNIWLLAKSPFTFKALAGFKKAVPSVLEPFGSLCLGWDTKESVNIPFDSSWGYHTPKSHAQTENFP